MNDIEKAKMNKLLGKPLLADLSSDEKREIDALKRTIFSPSVYSLPVVIPVRISREELDRRVIERASHLTIDPPKEGDPE
jgi:hypothetical protein